MFEKFKRPPLTDEEKLIKAGILTGRESADTKELAIQGTQAMGMPAVFGTFEQHPTPDATSTEDGRAALAELDDYVENRIQQLHEQRTTG